MILEDFKKTLQDPGETEGGTPQVEETDNEDLVCIDA